MEPVYFHVDLDAFFASVEQADNPALRGKAVVIGAAPGHRGVVAACSYEARTFGVHSAMPISEAYRRCPNAVYLPVRMQRYHEVSRHIMTLLDEYTPKVQQISVDEATLDMTGTDRLFGSSEEAARLIKERVKTETGLTISIGIARNRYLAKLASEYDKPDGLFSVGRDEETAFLDSLELSDLWGLGKKTLSRLEELGIDTVVRLRSQPLERLQAEMGSAGGSYLYNIARGVDPGIYRQARKSHSISNETTFEIDIDDPDEVRRTLLELSHQVMFRVLDEGLSAKTVFVKIRFADFRTTTAQRRLQSPPGSAEDIFSHAKELVNERWKGGPLRLLGVGVSAAAEELNAGPRQGELFDAGREAGGTESKQGRDGVDARRKRLEEAVYRMRQKGNPLTKASLLKRKKRHDQ